MIECVLGLMADNARVAQRIERLPPEQKVTGSNPVAGTIDLMQQGRPQHGIGPASFRSEGKG